MRGVFFCLYLKKFKNALINSVFDYGFTQRFTKRSQNGSIAGAIIEGWKDIDKRK